MDLYFLRHGAAVNRGEWEGEDSQRPLTEQGRQDVARMAGFFGRSASPPDIIVTSPYPRAKETAEIFGQHLGLQDKVVADERLEPGFDATRLGKLLKLFPEAKVAGVGRSRARLFDHYRRDHGGQSGAQEGRDGLRSDG